LLLLAAVTVIVRDNDGTIIAWFKGGDGSTVELKPDAPSAKSELSESVKTNETAVPPSPKLSGVAPPLNIAKPPPLDEWRKGRTELTVSKDGRGHFKTIQAALDALEEGQLVRVLDRGPYRENLAATPPQNTGLISDANTVIEFAGPLPGFDQPGASYHALSRTQGFRLNGFVFGAPNAQEPAAGLLSCGNASGLVIEHCSFLLPPHGGQKLWALLLPWGEQNYGTQPCFVRNCQMRGPLWLGTPDPKLCRDPYTVVVEQNWLREGQSSGVGLGSALGNFVIRHNIIEGASAPGIVAYAKPAESERLEIANNTMTCLGINWEGGEPLATNVTVCNNISIRPIEFDRESASLLPLARRSWQVGHNLYLHAPGKAEDIRNRARDVEAAMPFLSTDPNDANYLRIGRDGPAATLGADGDWPKYIGALPPGPAPDDGDWFIRLRQSSRSSKTEMAGRSPDAGKLTDLASSAEIPPLEIAPAPPRPRVVPKWAIDLRPFLLADLPFAREGIKEEDGLITATKDRWDLLRTRHLVPTAYQLSVVIDPAGNTDPPVFYLVADGHQCVALARGPVGNETGIGDVDGINAGNRFVTPSQVVEGTKPATVAWSVRPGVISLSVDGQTVYRWSGDFHRLSQRYHPEPDQVAIGQHGFPFRIKKVELASLAPEYESDTEPCAAPISPSALVTEPAALPGIESWSVETIENRGAIQQAVFSNDATLLATLGEDFTVRVWETGTHTLKHALPASLPGERALAFSPDNVRLAIAGSNGLQIFDLLGSRWCLPRQHRPFAARSLAWSPDGRVLAALVVSEGGTTCKLRLFDANNGSEWHSVEAQQFAVQGAARIAWSHDSQRIAVAPTREGAVSIDAASGDVLAVYRQQRCLGATWTNDGSLLLAVQPAEGKANELWRADTTTLLHTLKANDADSSFNGFTANGETLVATGGDGNISLWDTATGERLAGPPLVESASGESNGVALSNDRRWLARFGGRSGAFTLFDMAATGAVAYRGQAIALDQVASTQPIAWSPDGSELATRSFGDQIVLWDAHTFTARETRTAPFNPITQVCWRRDAKALTARVETSGLRIASAGGSLIEIGPESDGAARDKSPRNVLGALSRDGRWWATVDGGTVRVYATEDGQRIKMFPARTRSSPSCIAWSYDATKIASVSHTTDVFDAATGELLRTFPQSGNAVWSPDGRLLLLWHASPERLDVYDTLTGQPVVKLENHVPETSPWSAPSWSPDGTRIAGRGKLWEVRTGKVISRLPHYGTHAASGAPAWSPDSERLAYLTRENTIAIVHAGYCRIEAVLLALDRGRTLAISSHGHVRGPEGGEIDFVYVVQENDIHRTISPKEFAEKYGWKNDPSKVKLP
jgi:WD40 repeat protein